MHHQNGKKEKGEGNDNISKRNRIWRAGQRSFVLHKKGDSSSTKKRRIKRDGEGGKTGKKKRMKKAPGLTGAEGLCLRKHGCLSVKVVQDYSGRQNNCWTHSLRSRIEKNRPTNRKRLREGGGGGASAEAWSGTEKGLQQRRPTGK